MASQRLYNVNVGVLGHVDSGKTSLVAALSTTLSTAALDKNPQSRDRGITLDLGFSSFLLPPTEAITQAGYDGIQVTLVDCPGHASLIRTVVGGAQIIDAMILVVDVTKGIQTQTAECIVIGEITTDRMIVALNKIDQLDPEKREKHIKKATKLVKATLAATKFAGCPIVAVSARPSSPPPPASAPSINGAPTAGPSGGVDDLKTAIQSLIKVRDITAASTAAGDPFLFYIDHCFIVKGQGTVLTGTVASGHVELGNTIELPAFKQQRKVKSMQMFRKPVTVAQRGDRVGICVTQLDAGSIERGIACAPKTIPTFSGAIAAVGKVRFYPGTLNSMAKFHVIIGHATVMAKVQFFGVPRASQGSVPVLEPPLSPEFDFGAEYLYQEELYGLEGRPAASEGSIPSTPNNNINDNDAPLLAHHGPQWAYIQFEEPVTAPADALLIGARLDADLHTASCRIAFSGKIKTLLDPSSKEQVARLKVYKLKSREGVIERIEADGCTAVCRGMFGKDSDLSRFIRMQVQGPGGLEGNLEGSFGKSGKFKVRFQGPVVTRAADADKSQSGGGGGGLGAVRLVYKRFVFDPDKRKIAQ